MQRFYWKCIDLNGNPARGVSAVVTDSGTGAASTIYAASDPLQTPTVALASNTIVTTADGMVAFTAVNGQYNITMSGGGITPLTLNRWTLSDVTV